MLKGILKHLSVNIHLLIQTAPGGSARVRNADGPPRQTACVYFQQSSRLNTASLTGNLFISQSVTYEVKL